MASAFEKLLVYQKSGAVMPRPVDMDGGSVVVLRQNCFGFDVVESGTLSYDGETLTLGECESPHVFTDSELLALRHVIPSTRISKCRGFDFFLLAESG